jgi:hypothetical protein
MHLGLHVEQWLEREAGLVDHGTAAVHQAVLRQIPHRQRVRLDHRARIGFVESRQHPEQRRFAGAVGAAQSDAVVIADLPRDGFEEHAIGEALC